MADKKKALIVWGGWDGHTPEPCAKLFAPLLEEKGFEVRVENSMDVYTDKEYMSSLSLIVPIWTMGQITAEQEKGLLEAIHSGVGIAGFHGGMIDSFRGHCSYEMMTGGQFVGHPGGIIPTHEVQIVDPVHEITAGLDDFIIPNSEQYYMHVDPSVHVLCITEFSGDYGDPSTYPHGAIMPYAWTRTWGQGRVFAAAWGHTDKDFDIPECKEIVIRGMVWASR